MGKQRLTSNAVKTWRGETRKGAAMSDFSKTTVRKLAAKGIRLVGLQGENGYVLDDNGTCRIRTFREVLALAE
jgi:hypothetical protein